MASIFLDLGGTLVDFRPTYHEPIYYVLLKHNYDVSLKQIYRAISAYLSREDLKMVDGNPIIDYREILKTLSLKVDEGTEKELAQLNFVSISYSLYHDTLPFLKALKSLGYRIHIISNASKKIHQVLKETSLIEYVETVTASYEVGRMKPSKEIFLEGIKKAGEAGPYIGDLYEVDYLGAERAGLKPILLDRLDFYDDVNAVKVRSLMDAIKLIKS